jgi:hypothetical protein
MTATARAEARAFDWKLWLPGVVTPLACFVVDFAAGEYVLQFAPAALLSLAAMGIASLVVSRNHRETVAGLAAVGPMWIVGGVTLAVGIVLAVVSAFPLILSFALVWANPAGFLILGWALLGFTPLWTGVTYLKHAHVLTKSQVAAHGDAKTRALAIVSGVIAALIVIAAHALDSRFIDARLAELENKAPETWRAAFLSLHAYPLCGRYRCRQLVCSRLLQQFPMTPSETPDVPAQLDSVFKQAYGVPVSEACRNLD